MKKKIFILLLISQISIGQELEFGPNLSYGFTNIANSTISEGKAVIGSNLWTFNTGLGIVYNFKNRKSGIVNAINFEFSKMERGTISEQYSDSKFFVNGYSYNLNYRKSGEFGSQFCSVYGDIGFGYNTFSSKNFYSGTVDELVAFDRIKEKFELKTNEITFVFALGIDKLILKDKFLVFFELYGDAGISKLNFNGSYRTQSFGISSGIKYVYDLKKKK